MRILLHDFVGYPYPAQLARSLAERGHTVVFAWCPSITSNPGGEHHRRPDDPHTLELAPLPLDAPFDKRGLVRRWRTERRYGDVASALLPRVRPDVVLSSNTPLDAQKALLAAARSAGAGFVYWLQDLIGIAAARLLRRRLLLAGAAIGRYYVSLESALLRASDCVVAITDDFAPHLEAMGARRAPEVIENWAPVDELPVLPRRNPWSTRHGLDDSFVFLYAGTLGMKHDPLLLVRLAERFAGDPRVRVVVVSEGAGADWLAGEKDRRRLERLTLLPFEPFERMAETMASAEVLVALLEPDAGVFSVPSKVLAYLCAQRPLLLAVPPENLAARIVVRERAGVVVAPAEVDAFLEGAERLRADVGLRHAAAAAGRAYAERAFAIDSITSRFEEVLERAARAPRR